MVRVKRLLVVLVMAVGSLFVAGTPSQAHYAHCPLGDICLFNFVNGGHATAGSDIWYGFVVNPGTCFTLPFYAQNFADSWYNHNSNGKHVQFYDGNNCDGQQLSNGPHAAGTMGNFFVGSHGHASEDTINRASSIWGNTG